MKPENGFPCSFIDLARLGAGNWRRDALTVLMLKLLEVLFLLTTAIALGWSVLSQHMLSTVLGSVKASALNLFDPIAGTFGLWLACKTLLQRPFRSLISIDMTFDIRRCLLGAALYLPANALGFAAMSVYASMRAGAWMMPFRHVEWPHDSNQIAASMAMLVAIPFLAFAEELFFRGWLTQTLGSHIRIPLIVVALVAVLFAAYHTQYEWRLKILMAFCSIGLSALSLRDRRLELAVGAHTMMNICAMLSSLFLTGPLPPPRTTATLFDPWIFFTLKGLLPFALVYLFLQKTNGWFTPRCPRPPTHVDVEPRAL